MKPEIEVKFLDANHDALRAKLKELGAECVQPMRLTKRKNYDFADGRLAAGRHGWVRLRDEGDKVTLAYKQLDDRSVDGMKEAQVTVDSFEAAEAILTAIGLDAKNYQETKRESWKLGDVEIELDEWPWLKPFVELEGHDEASLKELAAKLGLNWENVQYGSVEIGYRAEYGVSDKEFNTLTAVTFDEPVPALLEKGRRA